MQNLELDTFQYEDNLSIGTLQMEQIENGTKVIIELFPDNQSKESFENAEFSKVYDLLELVEKHGYNLDFPMPDNATEDDLTELSMSVFLGVETLMETILNLQDFKEHKVYPILHDLHKNYLLQELNSFLTYRARMETLSEDTDITVLENLYRIINTINETDQTRTENIKKYIASLEN